MKFFYPECRFIRHWNKIFFLCSVVALSLDPLFLYIPIINGTQKCLDMDRKLKIVLCVLRSFADLLYAFHIIIQFRTGYVSSNSVSGRNIVVCEPYKVAKNYLTSYFIIDVLAALPVPQFAVLVIIPNSLAPASFLTETENLLKFIILCQYVPRVTQACLFYKKVTKTSGFLMDKAWAGAAFNFFLYVLASHVVGALWYVFAIQSKMRCWHIACQRHNCHSKYLFCGKGRMEDYGFLNTSCLALERNEIKDSGDFDFGIFLDALQTHVLETRDFGQKILYCSWWGLQSLSSLGQGLKVSTYYGEILFAAFIAVVGLVLFALLLGNMQKYLESLSNLTHRIEEMKEKRREKDRTEDLMSHISLPEGLRQQVRKHNQYKWKMTRGVELDSFVRDLPRDLSMEIKRHLCLPSIKKVRLFKEMNKHILDAMCHSLKPVLYTENSFLVREGDPVHEMLFITHGELLCHTTDGERTIFSNSDLCGEELFTWALDPRSQQLPISTRTVKALTDVQAFVLLADDLKFIASQFRRLHSSVLRNTYRFYSQQWRTWGACFIQAAWRRHCKRKYAKILKEENKRVQDALVTGTESSTLSIGASVYVSRFSSNVLRNLRRNHIHHAHVLTPMLEHTLQKPAQPNFDVDGTIVTIL